LVQSIGLAGLLVATAGAFTVDFSVTPSAVLGACAGFSVLSSDVLLRTLRISPPLPVTASAKPNSIWGLLNWGVFMVSKRGGQGPRPELHIIQGIFYPRLGDPGGADPANYYFGQKTEVSRGILKNLTTRRTARKKQSRNLTSGVQEIDFYPLKLCDVRSCGPHRIQFYSLDETAKACSKVEESSDSKTSSQSALR
jgi:hypothetical protein